MTTNTSPPPPAAKARAPRKPGLIPLVWRAGATTGPLALAATGALAAATLGAPLAPAAATSLALVGGTIAARGNLRGRIRDTRSGFEGWQLSRGVARSRYDVLPHTVRLQPEGDFVLNTSAVWPDNKPVVYRPLAGDPPHSLWSGATGGGKSEGIIPQVYAAAMWGWQVIILDGKGGTEFDWIEDLDLPNVVVHTEAKKQQQALRELHDEMAERYAAFRDVRVRKTDTEGTPRMVRPKNLADWRRHARPGDPAPPPYILLVIDEFDAVTKHPKFGDDNSDYLEALSARTRGAGIMLMFTTQSPYADIMGGFIKQNVEARVQFGNPQQVHADMVIGEPARVYLAANHAPKERPPGRAVCVNVGGPDARIVQARLMDTARLAPTEDEWDARGTGAATPDAPVGGGAGSGVVAAVEPLGAGAHGVGGQGGVGSGAPGGRSLGLVVGSGRGASGATAAGVPPRGGNPPAESPPSPSPPLDVAPGRLPGPQPLAGWRRLVAGTVRLAVATPVRRLALRATVWRLVVGPRHRGGEIVRDRLVRRRERDRSGGVCDACGRHPRSGERGEGWQAEHRRPKWAGGTDDPANIWTLCTECHAIKTRSEKRARKFRDRLFGLAALERAPGYVWAAMVSTVVALWHGVVGNAIVWRPLAGSGPGFDDRFAGVLSGLLVAPPGGGIGVGIDVLIVASVVVLYIFLKTFPRSGGLDGVHELEKAEKQTPDTVGDAAAAQIWWKRKFHGARLWCAVAALSYLLVRLLVEVAPHLTTLVS